MYDYYDVVYPSDVDVFYVMMIAIVNDYDEKFSFSFVNDELENEIMIVMMIYFEYYFVFFDDDDVDECLLLMIHVNFLDQFFFFVGFPLIVADTFGISSVVFITEETKLSGCIIVGVEEEIAVDEVEIGIVCC